ncbi:MAG: glucokinase [Synechococcus sp.]
MNVVLSGDIGGTKTILRLTRTDISPAKAASNLFQRKYPSADFDDLVPMVKVFISRASEQLSQDFSSIGAACFGIAGPVVSNVSKLTNLGWTLSGDRLQRELEISKVELVNDFAAIGYGVTALENSDIFTLQAGFPVERGPIAVLGAGTGLGEAYLTWQGTHYQVYATEGGHTSFAPRSEQQEQLLEYLLQKHDRVSVERVVSGQGIVAIYQFLRDSGGQESAEVATTVRQWERDGSQDAGAAIGQAAVEGRDPLSVETMRLFVDAYGAEAGDFALKILPTAGLYVAGGIAPKILPLLQQGEFMHAFYDKGRLKSVLAPIPVRVVLNPEVGSIGAAVRATRLNP